MRKRAKVDENHGDVVRALRRIGCSVLSLAAVGQGCPDLLVCLRGRLVMLEVKDGAKAPSRRALTSHQQRFHRDWPVFVAETPEQAVRIVQTRADI